MIETIPIGWTFFNASNIILVGVEETFLYIRGIILYK
jgi:hypothetical protein